MYFSVILLYIVVFWRATSLLALGYYVLPSFINKGFIIIIIMECITKRHTCIPTYIRTHVHVLTYAYQESPLTLQAIVKQHRFAVAANSGHTQLRRRSYSVPWDVHNHIHHLLQSIPEDRHEGSLSYP